MRNHNFKSLNDLRPPRARSDDANDFSEELDLKFYMYTNLDLPYRKKGTASKLKPRSTSRGSGSTSSVEKPYTAVSSFFFILLIIVVEQNGIETIHLAIKADQLAQ